MMPSPVPGVSFRFIETNGIRMRLAEIGEGPLVLLAHGWPESWYSWRHQMIALAEAGYRVIAPDMRGYGETDKPGPVEAYDIVQLAADVVGVLDALGTERAHLVGHDWGSMVAANTALFHPTRLTSVTLMSVPYTGRSAGPPMTILAARFGDEFFYMLYHNEPGGIAAEYDSDPRSLLSRLYVSPDTPRHAPEVTDPKRAAGGWIPRLGAPMEPPAWLSPDDFDYVVAIFERAGFRGGVNYYRNVDRNWELTEPYADAIEVPVAFIAGERDGVIGEATAEALRARMTPVVSDLRDVVLIADVGHWVQQEAPDQTTKALIDFIASFGAEDPHV